MKYLENANPLEFSLLIQQTLNNPTAEDSLTINDIVELTFLTTEDKIFYINMLLDSGFNLECMDYYRYTPLMYAIDHLDLELCKFLTGKKANVDHASSGATTALMLAISLDAGDIVELLLKHGATKIDMLYLNNSILGYAVSKKADNVIERLHKLGYKMNGDVSQGMTALMWAVHFCHLSTVETLIKCGADVNEPGSRGQRPLTRTFGSVSKEAVEIAMLLHRNGARTDLTNRYGRTIYDSFAKNHPFRAFLDQESKDSKTTV